VTPKRAGQRTHWTEREIALLKLKYGKWPIKYLYFSLKRSRRAVEMMAWKLGLGRTRTRKRGKQIDQDRYEKIMTMTAVFNGVQPRHMFRDLRCNEHELSAIKHGAWATIVSDGVTQSSVARAAGVDHSSVIYGLRRHAERMAQAEAAG
jgi:hypothetical protein